MKKALSLFLCAALLLSLAACAGGSGAAASGGSTPAPSSEGAEERLRVGFGRAVITPNYSAKLEGYGTDRLHKTVLDDLMLTCVAISDAQDNTVLMITIDVVRIDNASAKSMAAKIGKKFDIPADNIAISATHTHSAPGASGISVVIDNKVLTAVQEAMDSRSPADMYYGTAKTQGLNFVRHYVMSDGSTVGDAYGIVGNNTYVGHVSEADNEMRVLQFKRDTGKDVLLVNWQAHPTLTGGSTKTDMSADYVGSFRQTIEKEADCLFAYYQGAAGNLNAFSRIDYENVVPNRDYRTHGKLLAKHCREALDNMIQLEAGPIRVEVNQFTATVDDTERHLAGAANEVKSYFENGHTLDETQIFASTVGLSSLFHAQAIANRADYGESRVVTLRAYSFGDFGFTTAPFEQFDTQGMYIRESSPFKGTFVICLAGGINGYLASEQAFETGAYEVDSRIFVRGTAEKVADILVDMLKSMK